MRENSGPEISEDCPIGFSNSFQSQILRKTKTNLQINPDPIGQYRDFRWS